MRGLAVSDFSLRGAAGQAVICSAQMLRGDEWYLFSERGLIREIRAYYASPQTETLARLELGGFDYAGRGYPLAPPDDSGSPT